MAHCLLVLLLLVSGLCSLCESAPLQTTLVGRSGSTSCVGDTVTYTCTLAAVAHGWRIPSLDLNEDITRVNPTFSDSQFTIATTADGGGANPITTTLTVTSSVSLNGANITCSDANLATTEIQETTGMVFGSPSAPGLTAEAGGDLVSYYFTIIPSSPSDCVLSYTITATSSDSSRNITVPTSGVDGSTPVNVGGFDMCTGTYSFSVAPVTIEGTGPSSESIVSGIPSATLSSNAPMLSDGIHCSTNVVLTCTATDIPTLRWFGNGSQITNAYTPNPLDPLQLIQPIDGIEATVINAVDSASGGDFSMITSTLSISSSSIDRINGGTIQCGSLETMSNNITINFTVLRSSRLTSTNLVLLVLGVVLLCGAIAGVCIIMLRLKSHQVEWLSWILLLCGVVLIVVVLIVVSVVLWVAVAFQDNTCDAAWQNSRDGLIIASFIFSVSVVITTATTMSCIFVLTKIKSKSKKIQDDTRRTWEIPMEDKKHGQQGGRVQALETGDLVEDFKRRGEGTKSGHLRATEEVFQQYSAAKQAESQYAVTQHNTPPVNVPPQTPTYSALETHEAGGEEKEKYDVLQHAKRKSDRAAAGVPNAKKGGVEKKEEYGELNNGEEDKKRELKPDEKAGGKVKAFETGEVLIEDFKKRGEGTTAAHLRAGEEVFQQYSASKQAESQYTVTQHNIPPMNGPPQTPGTYSSLATHEAGGEDKEKYDVLQHLKGKSAWAAAGAPNAKKKGVRNDKLM